MQRMHEEMRDGVEHMSMQQLNNQSTRLTFDILSDFSKRWRNESQLGTSVLVGVGSHDERRMESFERCAAKHMLVVDLCCIVKSRGDEATAKRQNSRERFDSNLNR